MTAAPLYSIADCVLSDVSERRTMRILMQKTGIPRIINEPSYILYLIQSSQIVCSPYHDKGAPICCGKGMFVCCGRGCFSVKNVRLGYGRRFVGNLHAEVRNGVGLSVRPGLCNEHTRIVYIIRSVHILFDFIACTSGSACAIRIRHMPTDCHPLVMHMPQEQTAWGRPPANRSSSHLLSSRRYLSRRCHPHSRSWQGLSWRTCRH